MKNTNKEYPYWMALAHMPEMKTWKKHAILNMINKTNISIIDFFQLETKKWAADYGLDLGEIKLLKEAKQDLANNSFILEDLIDQGYNIIPYVSKDYPPTLKKNLENPPILLYTKGNKKIFQTPSIAIVGSRKASKKSLEFTDLIAKKACDEQKIIVSGYAKGIDRKALESALKYNGKSIIVLPQGITTFTSGFKKFYKHIIQGDVLVLSSFYPKAPWSIPFAMARNPLIYGLANEIFVAESSNKGGTWSGVIDGLRKNRTIFIRNPSSREQNANDILIRKGAIPVDQTGQIVRRKETKNKIAQQTPIDEHLDTNILKILSKGPFTSKEVIKKMNLDWSIQKMTNYLKRHPRISTMKNTKPLKFSIKQKKIKQETLFKK